MREVARSYILTSNNASQTRWHKFQDNDLSLMSLLDWQPDTDLWQQGRTVILAVANSGC